MINHKDAAETAIEIIAAKQPITDMVLCRYLKQRRIDKNVADKYCYEVVFKFSNKDAKHVAIGFKNSGGGYELRSEYFKLSSSPKYITYVTNSKQNCDTKTDVANYDLNTSDVLKRECKNDAENFSDQPSIVSQNEEAKSGLKPTLKNKIEDESSLYEGYKDINDWVMNFGKLEQKKSLKQSSKMGFP